VRNARKLSGKTWNETEVSEVGSFDAMTRCRALTGVDTASYLLHSMAAFGNFSDLDRRSAEHSIEACIACGVKTIMYLGGLGRRETASQHLQSRLEPGDILACRPDCIRTIWFRAGVFIGSGRMVRWNTMTSGRWPISKRTSGSCSEPR
jgi:uncharacterized protein YbjT (DUF2867 family)